MDDRHRDGAFNELLTEQQLKNMSRHSKELISTTADSCCAESDINRLQHTCEDLFNVAENQHINTTHRVAAWNTLCAFIDRITTVQRQDDAFEAFLNDTLTRALELYIQFSHKAKPKSSKQLLASITSALRQRQSHVDLREAISNRLLCSIARDDGRLYTKPCLQILSQFLSKDILSFDGVLLTLEEFSDHYSERNETPIQQLLSFLLRTVIEGEFESVVSQAISVVLDKSSSARDTKHLADEPYESNESREAIWILPLENMLDMKEIPVDNLRAHVLPMLFKRNLHDYTYLLQRQGLESLEGNTRRTSNEDVNATPNFELLYSALRIGKELGLVQETEGLHISYTASSILLPTRSIRRLLASSSRLARLTGLSLLVRSHAMTRPFPNSSLKLLRRYLHMFFADTDANFRGEVFSLVQMLIDRLRAVTMALGRKSTTHPGNLPNGSPLKMETLEPYETFITWLVRFLTWELRPTASYQTHISALKTLSIVVRSGLDGFVHTGFWSKSALSETKWPLDVSIMTSGLRRLLLDMIMDPFEDVRQTSASILAMYCGIGLHEGGNACEHVSHALRRGDKLMLRTGRADHADGAAHLSSLMFRELGRTGIQTNPHHSPTLDLVTQIVDKLENQLQIADATLSTAVEKHPIHGLLISLRYILLQDDREIWSQKLSDKLVELLRLVWKVVKPTLCNDAPEGYLPEDLDDSSDTTSKDTLSYCWRALKESSLVLEAVIKIGLHWNDSLLRLADLTFTQLAELRHRGAFSTVAQTWVTCSINCHSMLRSDGTIAIQSWYREVLEILTRKTQINTRRSAGIPALICGLLITDKTGDLMAQALQDLSSIAARRMDSSTTYSSSLPQVHALNCIKDILKSTRLREHSETYIPQSLRLAAQSLRSPAWAIRNCGLMLFRAVIDRLLGTSDAHLEETVATRRITVQHHTELLDVLLDLLNISEQQEAEIESNTYEGVFPALQLLQRMHIPHDRLSIAKTRVLRLTVSKSSHIRDKAARTYASLMSMSNVEAEIKQRLGTSVLNQNAVHGALATAKYLIRALRTNLSSLAGKNTRSSQRDQTMPMAHFLRGCIATMAAASHLYHGNHCVVTRAAYVDVLVEIHECVETVSCSGQFQAQYLFSQVQLDVHVELVKALDTGSAQSGNAVLRAALARAMGIELGGGVEYSRHGLLEAILNVAYVDEDACSSFFAAIHLSSGIEASKFPRDVLLNASSKILNGDFGTTLRCEVQRFLIDIAAHDSDKFTDVQLASTLNETCWNVSTPLSKLSNQSFADQWLQLSVIALEYSINLQGSLSGDAELNNGHRVGSLCTVLGEQDLFTTEAIATALSRAKLLWQYLDDTDPLVLCRICFDAYDLLHDDDESTRQLASQITSRIVPDSNDTSVDGSLEPGEAGLILARYMVRKWHASSYFIQNAFHRTFGSFTGDDLAVSEQLRRLCIEDNTLFVEEKQNLYIDEARETKIWSQVSLKLLPNATPQALTRRLAHWVSDGLHALISKTESSHDGALGWTTKPEVFSLGLQVIYGSQILLHLVQHNLRLPVRPSTLRLQLARLSIAGRISDITPLWQFELDRVLALAIRGHLKNCKAVIDNLSS